jgi:fucose 4-O-acetylase-like acetyltransferase
MPFFLSGLLLKDRLKNQNSGETLVRSSVLRLLCPYFLWGYIHVLIIFSLGKFVNTPIAFQRICQQTALRIFGLISDGA